MVKNISGKIVGNILGDRRSKNVHFDYPSNDDSNDRDRCQKCGHGLYSHNKKGKCVVKSCKCNED